MNLIIFSKPFMIISRHNLLIFDCFTDSFLLNRRGQAVLNCTGYRYPTDFSTSHLENRLPSLLVDLKAVSPSGLILRYEALSEVPS